MDHPHSLHGCLHLGQNHPSIRRLFSAAQWSRLGVANGQYVLFSRDGYDHIGGHASVANHLVEDVGLGRTVARGTREGMILRNCDGTWLDRTRMYHNFPQLQEGFTKNAWPVFEGDFRLFVFGLTTQMLILTGPILLLPFAGNFRAIFLLEIVLIYVLRVLMTLHFRTSWLGVLAHALTTIIAINSYVQGKKRGVTWKGRNYEVG